MNLDLFVEDDHAGRRESRGRGGGGKEVGRGGEGGKGGGGGGGEGEGRENIVLSDVDLQVSSKSSDPTSVSVSLSRDGLEEQCGVACANTHTLSTEFPQQSGPQYDTGRQNIAPSPQCEPQYDAGRQEIVSPQSGPQYDAGRQEIVSPQSGPQYDAERQEIVSPQSRPQYDAERQEIVYPQSGPQYDAERQEIVISFEVDLQDSRDLISLNEEMVEMLNPKNTLRTPPPSVDLSPLECHTLQSEEVETLSAIYGSDFCTLNDRGTCFLISIRFLSDEIREEDMIKIWFSLPPNYPCVPLVFEIEANRSGSFSYHDADELYGLLMTESINRVGGMMVYDLVSIAQDYILELTKHKKEKALEQAAADQAKKETMELEEAFKKGSKASAIPSVLWDEQLKGEDPVQQSPPHEAKISEIENILREDLALRFRRCQLTMERELAQRERKFPYLYNLKPQTVFHGTLTKSLPSIVQRGLLIPGAGNDMKVRCGSSLGLGIYLSPTPDFSIAYTDSNRLIVCAALLGRVYNYSSTKEDREAHYHYHAVVFDDEWVVFNAAQVVPCYVIVVQRRDTPQHRHQPPPLSHLLNTSHQQEAEDTERERKSKLLARARKFLPYGFGPGSKTVIEDAASFDDDEEDYGEYQLLRYASEEEAEHRSGVVKEQSELQKFRYIQSNEKI